jgi:hypothetical protein
MCNLYSLTKGQQAIRDLAGAMHDVTGNLPLFPVIFPDYAAPIVRNAPNGVRELSTARWGMPSPVFARKGRSSDPGVTNVRNVSSPHWRRCLGEGKLQLSEPREMRAADAARRGIAALSGVAHAGVVAFSRKGDPATGEFSDAQLLG